MERKERISVLWLLVMVGGIVHALVELTPLFWGESVVAMPKDDAHMRGMMVFSAIFFFVLPALGELCVLYGARRWAYITNIVLVAVMLLLNTVHPIMDLAGAPLAQWFILPLVFVLNLLLLLDSIKLCKEGARCVELS